MDEKTPLLKETQSSGSEQSVEISNTVTLKRKLSLLNVTIFIITTITGAGIFVTPTGVLRGAGSVGSSLLIWILCGVYNLVLALCYAELGTAFPVAGGDYKYVQSTLGPLPGFMCLFVYIPMAPVSSAIMGRAVGEYLMPLAGVQCNYYIIVMLAVALNLSSAAMNTITVKWTARSLNVLMVAKGLAFCAIIVTGLAQLAKGNTENFTDPFSGSISNPSSIANALIPGYTSFAGWEFVCSLAEEMTNPKRDLPLALLIALLVTTGIYVMVNVAYFTVLTPAQIVSTNAVGTLFASKVMPGYEWMIPVFVALSAIGCMQALYLGLPRFWYAGSRDKQLPEILSYLSVHYCTPVPAIALQLVLSIFFCSATFFDIQALFMMVGMNLMFKMALALLSLIYIKIKMKHLKRTIQVPLPIVVVCFLIIVVINCLAIVQEPFINGFGLLLFVMSIPLYYIGELIRSSRRSGSIGDRVTRYLQCIFLVVPAATEEQEKLN